MRSLSILCFATLVAQSSISSAKKEPLRLSPSSKWVVNYAKDYCRLARSFGEGENKITMIFDKYGPGDRFALTLAGKAAQNGKQRNEAMFKFGPNEPYQKEHYFPGNLGEEPALVFSTVSITPDEIKKEKNDKNSVLLDPAPFDASRLAAIRYLEITKPFYETRILETGPMAKALAQVDTCLDSLIASWGIDVEQHKNLKRKAMYKGDPQNWLRDSDYPRDMLNASQPGLVTYRLNIGANGKPTACNIQRTTRPKEFDDAVCQSLMKRAEFEPALDSNGNAIASYNLGNVLFRMLGSFPSDAVK